MMESSVLIVALRRLQKPPSRVGVAIQTLAENKRSSTTMQELKNPYKIKAFSLLKG